ncbi:MAG: hypothetical protein KAH38_01890 [Candidatus Hydrogenedentes bacterium]|nr:hypothetical protein [Candidatus Hydrogenedentota bacterium]
MLYSNVELPMEQDQRDRMVDEQIIARGIHDQPVLTAMRRVPQLITIIREKNETFFRHEGIACRFVPLIGEREWRE